MAARSGVGPVPEFSGLALRELVPDEASTSAEVSYDFGQFHSSLNMDSPWKGNCQDCLGEDLPEVTPRRIRDLLGHHTAYRARLPGAGIFRCSITGLGFEVKSAVTVTYRYNTWTTHLSKADQEMWMPAGPLFHIEVQPGVVQAVRLPHFICLAEDVNTSLCSIAHFESGKMTLESPTRLMAFSAVLENPSFSALGVLWRKIRSAFCSLPVHSLVLIFQQLNAASTTLHLYLIPDDKSVKRAIEEQEVNWNSKLIPKPPPFRTLFLGRNYRVTSTKQAEITPEEQLPLCHKNLNEQQPFVEIYIADMGGGTGLHMTDTRDGTEVWQASLRSGDIDHSARVFKASSGQYRVSELRLWSLNLFLWSPLSSGLSASFPSLMIVSRQKAVKLQPQTSIPTLSTARSVPRWWVKRRSAGDPPNWFAFSGARRAAVTENELQLVKFPVRS
ncbi:NACHT, LRR and PYD domains-containing protein 1a allele 5-like isoform X3 [Rissa tridactyla]|uniref:NACHT, LRR and PYD domains-containing protein 1a allele 5-like isoform X3 n=1 Tax=Rissa tridactyla TaxID=75485 RepID=UPI0023BB1329|nr:NACHT, LRR and PYD domains-containing protein 1a allele 5-like isoform X3 [Rissa tridactyla]